MAATNITYYVLERSGMLDNRGVPLASFDGEFPAA
jgi:hypothetical protein